MGAELAVRHAQALATSRDDWTVMREQAAALVPTGFLPAAIKTPEQAIAIMLKGRELGIPPMYALSNIAVIQGKPAANAELMLALIYRDHGDDAVLFTEATNARAAISYKRRGWKERRTFAFTLEDAKQAGLSGGNWAKYPGAMLRARCISAVARLAFPDTIGGMHTPDELGATVDGETGNVIEAPAPTVGEWPRPQPTQSLPPAPDDPTDAELAGLSEPPAEPKTLAEHYDALCGLAFSEGIEYEPRPVGADDEWILANGTDLKARLRAASAK